MSCSASKLTGSKRFSRFKTTRQFEVSLGLNISATIDPFNVVFRVFLISFMSFSRVTSVFFNASNSFS